MSPVTLYLARWVLPVTRPPLERGGVVVRDGRILDLGLASDLRLRFPEARMVDLGPAVLFPGLVNAHTHLSLTGLGATLPTGDFLPWLRAVVRAASALTEDEVRGAVRAGLAESHRLGTVALGEITTRGEGVSELGSTPGIAVRIYFEFLGVTEPAARRRYSEACTRAQAAHPRSGRDTLPVGAGLSPHAPYSVWPALWREAASFCAEHDLRWSSHLAETPAEALFLRQGRGPLREHLVELGVWDGTFPVPGSSAVEFLDGEGVLGPRALFVHGLHLDRGDIARLARAGASLCLCPRSNAWLGLPPPPLRDLVASGLRLCLGTDSTASNADLGMWGELRALSAIAPELSPATILRMATLHGAEALGFAEVVGSLEPGRLAPLAVLPRAEPRSDPSAFWMEEGIESTLFRPGSEGSGNP